MLAMRRSSTVMDISKRGGRTFLISGSDDGIYRNMGSSDKVSGRLHRDRIPSDSSVALAEAGNELYFWWHRQ